MKTNKFFEEYCKDNIILNFEGDIHTFTEGVAFVFSSSTYENGNKTYLKTETDKGVDIKVVNEDSGLEVLQHFEIYGEVIRQYNEIKNLNDDEKVLTNATSAKFSVPYKGLIPWNDDRRFKLHICKAAWSAEAQWHSGSLVDFGLNPMRYLEKGLQGPAKITISSKGSWSTGTYYPIVILEDLEKGETYFMEHEVCYYEEKAKAYYEKNVVTGKTGAGAGVSFRVARGVSMRTGSGASQVVRGNVSEVFDGTLYITNFRIVLLAPKYGFDLHISKITQLLYKTNGFQVYVGSKCFSVLTDDIKTIQELILFMNEHKIFKDEKIINKKTKISERQNAEALREFKKLLDEGIITEEEFEAKKKQLLGL